MNERRETQADPRLTFDTFVVGPANRLAAAAARRAAESPGASFNPLFLYAASGLGKSHILSAIANHSARVHPGNGIAYRTLEGYLDELMEALEAKGPGGMRDRYTDDAILLLDDVQFLTGQPQAQELLLRTLDAMTERGAQVVLASDRPPSEIDELDERLLSRFSGGLIVDMGAPDYETRVAILRRKAEERNSPLGEGVAEAMARYPFRNVRELQGALNRVVALQDLEGRPVAKEEVPELLGELPRRKPAGAPAGAGAHPDASAGDEEGSGAPEPPRWRVEVQAAVRSAESRGFEAERIGRLLTSEEEAAGWQEALDRFREGVRRLEAIREELEALGNPWPEAAESLLLDPERLGEAEQLLASARERARPFPEIPGGPELDGLGTEVPRLAVGAARRLLDDERPDFNPLYVHASDPSLGRAFLEAVGRSARARDPSTRVGLISVEAFSQDFIRAISEGVAGAWRERWWSVEVLLLEGAEQLASTERAQEEFFHLFEALKRRSARIFLAADRPPSRVEGVDDRLRSRFEGGLVIALAEAGEGVPPDGPREPGGAGLRNPSAAEGAYASAAPASPNAPAAHSGEAGPSGDGAPSRDGAVAASGEEVPSEEAAVAGWTPPRERVVWEWPWVEERIAGEGDDGD